MAVPQEPVTISPAELEALNAKLSTLRHNINNCLMKVTLAADLIRTKPEVAERMTSAIADQPAKIMEELRTFSAALEGQFGITRDRRSAE